MKIMLSKALVFAVIVLFIGTAFLPNMTSETESNNWWDTEWNYRKEIQIDSATPDYQMVIEVWKEDGHDDITNGIIDCDGHCNDNFSDLRFIGSSSVVLPYWIENTSVDGGHHYTRIWVKTSGESIIYMYYGNPIAPPVSNGSETFVFFDDFDSYNTDIWNEFDTLDKITVTAEEGLLHIEYGSVTTGTSAGVNTSETVANN